jgi:hypothetical protein
LRSRILQGLVIKRTPSGENRINPGYGRRGFSSYSTIVNEASFIDLVSVESLPPEFFLLQALADYVHAKSPPNDTSHLYLCIIEKAITKVGIPEICPSKDSGGRDSTETVARKGLRSSRRKRAENYSYRFSALIPFSPERILTRIYFRYRELL